MDPLVVNPRQRTVDLPAPPSRPEPGRASFDRIHADAARMDGMVKLLVGLVLVVMPIGLVLAGAVGLWALVQRHEVRFWALALGIPGLLLMTVGLGLMALGLWKMVSGRGRG